MCKKCGAGEQAVDGASPLRREWERVVTKRDCLSLAAMVCAGDATIVALTAVSGDALSMLVEAQELEALRVVLPQAKNLGHLRDMVTGYSPLMRAVMLERVPVVQLAVELGLSAFFSEVDAKEGRSPLQMLTDGVDVWPWHERDRYLVVGDARNVKEHRDDYGHMCMIPLGNSGRLERRDAMLELLNRALGRRAAVAGVAGAALRAQQAASNGELLAPPPFPRTVWLLVYAACAVRERECVLPLVCRFFHHLLPARDRFFNVTRELLLAPPPAAHPLSQLERRRPNFELLADRATPSMAYVVSRSSSQWPWRVAAMLEALAKGPHVPVLCAWLKVGTVTLMGQLMTLNSDVVSEPLARVAHPNGCVVECSVVTQDPGPYSHDLVTLTCRNGAGRFVSFMLPTQSLAYASFLRATYDQIGPRVALEGIARAAELLGAPELRDENAFVHFVSVLLQANSTNAEVSFSSAFYRKFLLEATGRLRVVGGDHHEQRAAEEGSVPVLGPRHSVVSVTQWNSAKLAAFLESHDLAAAVPAVRERQLTGQDLVTRRFVQFIPSHVNAQQRTELLSALQTLHESMFQ